MCVTMPKTMKRTKTNSDRFRLRFRPACLVRAGLSDTLAQRGDILIRAEKGKTKPSTFYVAAGKVVKKNPGATLPGSASDACWMMRSRAPATCSRMARLS